MPAVHKKIFNSPHRACTECFRLSVAFAAIRGRRKQQQRTSFSARHNDRCLRQATPASPSSCARLESSRASAGPARPVCSISGSLRCWESFRATTFSTSRSSSTGWSSSNNNYKSRRETRVPWLLRYVSHLHHRRRRPNWEPIGTPTERIHDFTTSSTRKCSRSNSRFRSQPRHGRSG